jgi:hypothetical protein
MDSLALMGLIRLDMPGGTVFLSEGGFIDWGGDIYTAKDDTYGTLASVQSLSEGVNEQVPSLKMTLMPPGETDAATLSQPGDQTSRVRLYFAEYDGGAGTVIGTPDLVFDGQVDRTRLTIARDQRQLEIEVVSTAERLFERNAGSPISPSFHKVLFPGETGQDNATGLSRNIAWGVESPASAGVGSGRGSRSFGYAESNRGGMQE